MSSAPWRTIARASASLAREGFLSGEPGKGYVVAPLTHDEANELYPILGVLEAMAVRTSSYSTVDLDDLERLNAALSKIGVEPEQAIDANFAWHERLIATCPNTRLVAMVRALWLQVRRYEFAFYAPGKARVRQSVDLHRGIVEALRRGARAQATRLTEEHWLTDLGDLLPRIRNESLSEPVTRSG